jgi:hypothetical protein
MRVDPVTLEIIRGSLASTIRDMELLMERCAMSPFIKEKKDYFVGVFDTRGRIVACHISGSGPGMLAETLRWQERTTNTEGGPRPRPEHHQRNEGREPDVPVTATGLIGCDRCPEARP